MHREMGTATAVIGARLCVVSDDQRGRSYPLAAARVTIGRGANNDIVTAEPRASRLHAEIQRRGPAPRFLLVDPGSTNGTLLNGQRVTQAELHDGDLIEIGAFRLAFQLGDGRGPAPRPSTTLAPVPATPDTASTATVAPPPTAEGISKLRAGAALTVGRDPGNDVVLDNPQVSRRHARLRRLPDGGVFVDDLHSTNGTFLDGQQVAGTAAVPSGAVLAVGPFRLLYHDGRLIKGGEDGTVRIDCLGLGKTVGGGKVLLSDLTFSILPREFVCLVGGSGAGKSTLLDALSGVRPANQGEVRYNGTDYYPQMDAYRSAIGYVPQDDIVPTELTVARALHYAAKLRLPADMSAAEVRARIDEVLDDLGLTEHRDKVIKDLSGGQRKRVSIGAELLSKPTIFFLDEPTSGLDPGLEARMMAQLRKLADQGRTVVLITHATQNVELCDQIAFLAPGGHLAYYGPPREALAYFEEFGVAKFADIYTAIDREPAKAVWAARFRASPKYNKNVGARLAGAGGGTDSGATGTTGAHLAALAKAQGRPPAGKQVAPLRQFAILSQRYLETIWRDRRNLLTLLIQAPIIALMVAAVFRGRIFDTTPLAAGGTGDNGAVRKLLFLLAMVAVWFGTSNAAREIVKEAAMYGRERRINLRIGPYIASKFAVLTGLSLAQNLLLLLPLALVGVGLPQLPPLYAALVLGSVAGIGMGLAISAQASNPDRAGSLVPVILIPQVIFSGVLVNLNDYWIGRLLSHFMVTKWTFRALGALSDLDAIPVPKQLFRGLPPELAPQLTANNPALTFDAARGAYYLLPVAHAEFTQHPALYLAILALFTAAAVGLIVTFQRRKDRS